MKRKKKEEGVSLRIDSEILGCSVFADRIDRLGAFIWMLKEAYPDGDLRFSVRGLARQWGWAEAKARRFLDQLELHNFVRRTSDAPTPLISVCNYERFCPPSTGGDARVTHFFQKPDNSARRKLRHFVVKTRGEAFARSWIDEAVADVAETATGYEITMQSEFGAKYLANDLDAERPEGRTIVLEIKRARSG